MKKETPKAPAALSSRTKTVLALSGLFVVWMAVFGPVLFGQKNLCEDAVQLEYPNRVFAQMSIQQGEFPHWVPFQFSGMPFFAAQLPGVLYPTNLLLSLLPVKGEPFWYLIQLFALLHILIGGFGMFCYVRRAKGLSRQASLFAGTSFMLGGFLICHQVHPMMINIVAWLPLVMLFLELGALRKHLDFNVWAGLILGLSMLAGQPQITVYELLFLAVFAGYLWLWPARRSFASLWRIAVTFCIAGAIGSLQMLPALELNGLSARAAWSFAQACEGSMSIGHFLNFIMPKLFGAWTGQPGREVPAFWLNDSFHSGYYTYWETTFYTGIPVLIFALYRFRRLRSEPLTGFFAVWGVISLVFAMGNHTPFYKMVCDAVPLLGSFRNAARLLFTWNMLLPVLAAFTFDELRSGAIDKKGKTWLYAIGGAMLLSGLLAAGGVFASFWPEMRLENRASFSAAQGVVLAMIAAGFLGVLFYFYKSAKTKVPAVLLLLLLCVDMVVYSLGHHQSETSAVAFFNTNRNIAKSLFDERKKEVFRSSMRQFILEPEVAIGRQNGVMILNKSQGLIDGIELVEGYSPLSLKYRLPPLHGRNFDRLLDLLNVKFYINPEYGTTSDQAIMINPDFLPRARIFHAARVITDSAAVEAKLNAPDFDYRNELILDAAPPFSLSADACTQSDTAIVTSCKNNSMELSVTADADGILWLSEIWYPLWKATIDGAPAPILRADFSFRAIPVKKGTHRVSLKYHSVIFDRTMALALCAIAFSVAVLVVSRLRNRRISGVKIPS